MSAGRTRGIAGFVRIRVICGRKCQFIAPFCGNFEIPIHILYALLNDIFGVARHVHLNIINPFDVAGIVSFAFARFGDDGYSQKSFVRRW